MKMIAAFGAVQSEALDRPSAPKRYGTVLADPPWMERGGGRIPRGSDRHYSLMRTEDIAALPVPAIAAPDAHLYLWTTNGHLPDGLEVLRAWGFRYVTTITWAKDRFGLGQYFRGQTEHCLFGVRGRVPYVVRPDGRRAQGRTLVSAPRREHSRKPEELRRMAELVSPGPRVELFARRRAESWDAWGDELERSDLSMDVYFRVTVEGPPAGRGRRR